MVARAFSSFRPRNKKMGTYHFLKNFSLSRDFLILFAVHPLKKVRGERERERERERVYEGESKKKKISPKSNEDIIHARMNDGREKSQIFFSPNFNR